MSSLPATYESVAVFIMYHLQNGSSVAVIESYIYAIKWHHSIYFPNKQDPTNHPTIANLLETCKRLRIHHVQKKDPVTPEHLADIHRLIGGTDASLLLYRNYTMMVVAFAGFLRFDELINIKCNDVVFYNSYMSIFIEKSKCDQYRDGRDVLIAKSNSTMCPVKTFENYISKCNLDMNSDSFVFRAVTWYKTSGSYSLKKSNKPLSYSTVRTNLLQLLESIGLNPNRFGTHSLRAGGATAAANNGVNDRLFKRHGRWKSERAKDGYVKDNLLSLLSVSLSLGL